MKVAPTALYRCEKCKEQVWFNAAPPSGKHEMGECFGKWLPVKSLIAIDSETALIRPGRAAPELACVSYAYDEYSGIIHYTNSLPYLHEVLDKAIAGTHVLIGQNMAFDMCVFMANFPELIAKVFAAYDADGVTCTMLRQQLLDIRDDIYRGYVSHTGEWRKHRYDLSSLSHRYGMGHLEKDEWRLKYGQLRDLPLEEWPEGAKEYPLKDAVITLEVFKAQGREYVPDEFEQARAFLALQLISVWGIKTDPIAVSMLRGDTEAAIDGLRAELMAHGLVRPNGTRDMKLAQATIAKAWGDRPPRLTATGRMALDADACEASEDPLMATYAEYTTLNTVLNKDLPMLEAGATTPIHTRFRLLETCRVSSSGPNIQNIRRTVGIRECFVPRPGHCFVQVDYPALELRTLAEVCYRWFDYSTLGDALTEGLDPHSLVASQLMNVPYEEVLARIEEHEPVADESRQLAKAANFGYPGGLGAKTFVAFAKASTGKDISLEQANELKATWQRTWTEMVPYMAHINSLKQDGTFYVEHPSTGNLYSSHSFCATANMPFQHLGAACAKRGTYNVLRACYAEPHSVLYGGRPVNFIHDELICELPYAAWGPERTHKAAYEFARLFEDGARSYLRVPITCKPVLMGKWSKKAKQLLDENGLLKVWHE